MLVPLLNALEEAAQLSSDKDGTKKARFMCRRMQVPFVEMVVDHFFGRTWTVLKFQDRTGMGIRG